MFGLDESSEISEIVQKSVLQLVRLYPSFEDSSQFVQLSDGRFFLTLLQTLPNFKLAEPINCIGEQLSLAVKVSIIKNISKSLIKYHQTQLLKDVSSLDVNYVELCMGNKKEIFRLITILLSAINSKQASKAAFEQKLSKLKFQQSEILRIMNENSEKIGEECMSPTHKSWRLSEQKKIFAKMQYLQGRIQELELINRDLQEKAGEIRECYEQQLGKNKKCQQQINKLIVINNEIREQNEELERSVKVLKIQETTGKKKLQVVKQKYEQKVLRIEEQLRQIYLICENQKGEISRLGNIKSINQEIIKQNEILRQQNVKLESERNQIKKINKLHNEQLVALKAHCSKLQIKIQQMSIILKSNISSQKHKWSIFDLDDLHQSNKYRIKDHLQWVNFRDQQNIQQNIQNPNCARGEDDNFEIRTITERSLEDSGCFANLKQNQSIIMNNSQLLSLSNVYGMEKGSEQDNKKINNKERSSLQIGKRDYDYEQQIQLLTFVIIDLQKQLEEANKRNPAFLLQNNSMSASRMQKFRYKVKQMFNKTPLSSFIR